jgi:hypothetical protein
VTGFIILTRIQAGIVASVDYKSAKSTTATVVSVTELRPTNPSQDGSNDQPYRVCFTIDNIDQVATDMRQGYQSAEAQRLARNGPRCKVTTKVTLAKKLNNGDKLTVIYLLENQYQIDIASATAFGEDL